MNGNCIRDRERAPKGRHFFCFGDSSVGRVRRGLGVVVYTVGWEKLPVGAAEEKPYDAAAFSSTHFGQSCS